jgi:PBP1b-binding outer membrane lipoprotein LpoB
MKRFLLPALAAAMMLGGCSKKEEAEPKPEVEVKLAPATVEDVEQSITGPATVFPSRRATTSPRARLWQCSNRATSRRLRTRLWPT